MIRSSDTLSESPSKAESDPGFDLQMSLLSLFHEIDRTLETIRRIEEAAGPLPYVIVTPNAGGANARS
jgi:hypothetical protein